MQIVFGFAAICCGTICARQAGNRRSGLAIPLRKQGIFTFSSLSRLDKAANEKAFRRR
jgi:hypothetical protein